MPKMPSPKTLSKELAYNGYLKVNRVKLAEGNKTYHREVIMRGHSVCVFIYDSKLKKVLFTEQFRIGKYPEPGQLIECVAGMIDDGETPETAACRETLEETGLTIAKDQLQHAGTFMLSPGVLSEQTTIFLVDTDLSAVNTNKLHGQEHENESITLKLMTYNEAKALFPQDATANAIVPTMARDKWLKVVGL